MVYEARVGQTFLLGASAWRIERITRDRVLVSPAPGAPGQMPFWKGEGVGRPLELGRALGRFTRELAAEREPAAIACLRRDHDLDERAARNLLQYLRDQREATGVLPSDRTIVVERFRDEIGDWRLCLLSPFGGRVHAPVGDGARRACCATASAWTPRRSGRTTASSCTSPTPTSRRPADVVALDADEVEDLVVAGARRAAPSSARASARTPRARC